MICYTTAELAPVWHAFYNTHASGIAPLTIDVQLMDSAKAIAKTLAPCSSSNLAFTEDGLWLWHNGLKIQPNWIGEIPRLRKANLRNELLARACQLELKPTIFDATAGLGHDSLLMAWLGASTITLYEQNPWLYLLLQHAKLHTLAYAHTMGYQRLIDALNCMHINYGDATIAMQQLAPTTHSVDIVYVDPMFPKQANAKKQAQVKKHMQVLQQLLEVDKLSAVAHQQETTLLTLARQLAKRVVVKRPSFAEYLALQTPTHQWKGDSCRFDAYY